LPVCSFSIRVRLLGIVTSDRCEGSRGKRPGCNGVARLNYKMNEKPDTFDAVPRDGKTSQELFPSVYEDLRKLAEYRLAMLAPGQTLQATALVHEAWP
jgi:hypothetical protein